MTHHFTGRMGTKGEAIQYITQGDGPAVVFIHAGLVDSRMWDYQLEAFVEHYRVVRFDARGFGMSDIPKREFSPVDDVKALLEFLKIEKASIIGCSMGGGTALEFALEYPQMVDRLVLIGPSVRGYTYSREMDKKVSELFAAIGEMGTPEGVRLFLEDPYWQYGVPAKEYPEARRFFSALVKENTHALGWYPKHIQLKPETALARAPGLAAPTLIIIGDRESTDNKAAAKALYEAAPDVVMVEIPGAGHMVNLEQPGEFNRIVLAFLSGSEF